jgi:hypothetical protein
VVRANNDAAKIASCPGRRNCHKRARTAHRCGINRPTGEAYRFARVRVVFFRVSSGTVPFFGGGSFTPARRALESPIAIACVVESAPCPHRE